MTAVSVTKAVSAADLSGARTLVEAHIGHERGTAVLAPDWAEKAARLVAAARLVVFVAREGRVAVGYASVTTDVATWTGEEFAHLDCLFVENGRRGAGIGRSLVAAAVDDARSRGIRELQWQTPHWNADAIGFYETLGAARQAKERFSLAL